MARKHIDKVGQLGAEGLLRNRAITHPQGEKEALPEFEDVEGGERGRDLAGREEGMKRGKRRCSDFTVCWCH